MEIRAKFIGGNSLGYVNGNLYSLKIKSNTIQRTDGTGKCVYGSIKAFFNNWKVL